jgi:hypothetical protein
MKLKTIHLALVFLTLTGSNAYAEYWFCYASHVSSDGTKALFLSEVFFSASDGLTLQTSYSERLERMGISNDGANCYPDSESDAVDRERNDTINTYRNIGYSIRNVSQ